MRGGRGVAQGDRPSSSPDPSARDVALFEPPRYCAVPQTRVTATAVEGPAKAAGHRHVAQEASGIDYTGGGTGLLPVPPALWDTNAERSPASLQDTRSQGTGPQSNKIRTNGSSVPWAPFAVTDVVP